MDVGELERNNEKYSEYVKYFEYRIARNMKMIGHTDAAQHFVRYNFWDMGQSLKSSLQSPFLALETPRLRFKNDNGENAQAHYEGAITIGASWEEGKEASRQYAQDKCYAILLKVVARMNRDAENLLIPDFVFDGNTATPVIDLFGKYVGLRFPLVLPAQFTLALDPDDWNDTDDTDTPVPFSIVIDGSTQIALKQGEMHTCSLPEPGTANVVDSIGTVLATAPVPSNSNVPIPLLDVEHTDSDGLPAVRKAMEPFVATPFTPAIFKLNNVTVGSAGNAGQLLRKVIRPTGVFVSTYDGIDANIVANSPIIQNGGTIDSTGAEQAFQFTTLLDEIAENGIYDANTKTLRFTSVLPTPKNTAMLIKTGQTISSFLHDDGYYQIGRPTSALVLSQLNPIGTYARFYLIPSTNIVCDFSLVDAETGQFMMYDKSDVTTGRAIAAHGLYGATKSVAGKTGWMPVNRRMLEWLRTDGQTWAWNNSPFNFNGSGIGDYLTTNTIVHSSAGTQIWMHYNYNGPVYSQARGVTESLPTMFCRVGNISEL